VEIAGCEEQAAALTLIITQREPNWSYLGGRGAQ